jgi:protein tyrosine phosphatase (PTP) superfamily phosphohydrolase (DUF442 family)
MGLSIGKIFSGVINAVEAPFRGGGKAVGDKPDSASDIKDGFVNDVAPAAGLVELTGIKFPVNHYMAKVSDGLYRGARVDGDDGGYTQLRNAGIKSIVDLTAEGTDDESMAAKNGFKLLNIPIVDNTAPTTAQMTQFLNYATDPANQPVYVHCEAGKGRTGVAVACYRMAVEGWTADQAIADGAKYGLGLESQVSFIRDFGQKLDAGQIPGYPVQAQ